MCPCHFNLFKYFWPGRVHSDTLYTKQPKVFQQPEFPRMQFKASIILVKSHNYIIKCLKISSNIVRVVYHVISGHVRSATMCLHHMPLVVQVAQ